MPNAHLYPYSRLRPCLNCGEQFDRTLEFCFKCGAKRGAAKWDSAKTEGQNEINLLEVYSSKSLGELYDLSIKRRNKNNDLTRVKSLVEDLDCIGTFYYEDLVRRLNKSDYESWCSSIEDTDIEIFQLVQPFKYEAYCRAKAIFIGTELRASGIWSYRKWHPCLIAQLEVAERKMIEPYSLQIYQRTKYLMEQTLSERAKPRMNKNQRRAILGGLAVIVLMLLLPPFMNKIGTSKGYYFLFWQPEKALVIDVRRLIVQCALVLLMTGGLLFYLQGERYKH